MESRIKRLKVSDSSEEKWKVCSEACPISRLNDDCLLQIFRLLPIWDKIRASKVCGHWSTLIEVSWSSENTIDNKRTSWGRSLTGWDGVITVAAVQEILRLCGRYVTRLQFNSRNESELGCNPVCAFMASKRLFSSIREFCPSLRWIDVSGLELTLPGVDFLAAEYASGLRHLSVGPCRDGSGLATLFRRATRLNSLTLKNLSIPGTCFLELAGEQLRELTLDSVFVTSPDSLCEAFERFVLLEKLSLRVDFLRSRYLDRILDAVSKKAPLKTLVVNSHLHPPDPNFAYLTRLGQLVQLEHTTTNDRFLQLIAGHCQQLEKITLKESEEVSDFGLTHLARLPKLAELRLRGVKAVTGASLATLTRLRSLKCASCPKLRTDNLVSLVESALGLRWLELKDCLVVGYEQLVRDATSLVLQGNYKRINNADDVLTLCLRSDDCSQERPSTRKVSDKLIILRGHSRLLRPVRLSR